MSTHSLLMSLAARYGVRHCNAEAPTVSRIAARDGLTLSFLDWRGDGEAILFLHGGALTAHSWDLVCLGMRDDFRCLALDLRGHGDSGWADEYRVEQAIDDIGILVAHLGVDRVHLVGNSLGGMIAAHYAAIHRESIASLTLVDVGPNVDFGATRTIRDYIECVDGLESLEAAIEVGMRVSPNIDRIALEYRLRHSMHEDEDRRVRWKQDRRRMHDYQYFLGKIDEISALAPRIEAPVLVVRGARSRVFSDAAAQGCAALFPRGEWVRIEDSGHNIQEANPGEFIVALRRFLGTCANRSDTRSA